MLETRGVIVRLEGRDALVEGAQQGGCGACSGSKSCGSGKLNQLLGVRQRQFKICNESDAQVGDEVEIVVPEGELLRNALVLYGMPILVMFAGAVAGKGALAVMLGQDAATAMGALAGLSVGFLLASRYAASRRNNVSVQSVPRKIRS